MRRLAVAVAGTALLVVTSGCTTTSSGPGGVIGVVRAEVAPQLVDELRGNVHIKGRSFVFASYRDGRPSDTIDELSRLVRRELIEACLPHPDIRLRRQQPLDLPEQPHRMNEVDCGEPATDVDMLVGIELRPSRGGEWELVLTADTTGGNRLPLLVRHRVRPTPDELERVARSRPAVGVAGTRLLPFAGAKEEMARMLARNLTCTGTLWGDAVHVDTTAVDCPFDLDVLSMTAGHLRRMAMVDVVASPGDGVVELTADSYDDGGVRLLWLTGPDGLSVRAHYTLPSDTSCGGEPGRDGSGDLVAVGVASWREQSGASEAIQKRRAVVAAEIDARRQLLEQIGPVMVEGSVTVEDLLLRGELTRQWVSGILRTSRVGQPRYDDEEGTVELTLRLDRDQLVESLRGVGP